MFIRQNIYDLGGDWADLILWYARGIRAMSARRLDDITSWQFFAAIHGYSRWLWNFHGITQPGDPEPKDDQNDPVFINQCRHLSGYFLPWHRGYLLAMERQIRHEIKSLGGPYDKWALPYWDCFEEGRGQIPPAFASPDWPDGIGDNPLYIVQRWGPMSRGLDEGAEAWDYDGAEVRGYETGFHWLQDGGPARQAHFKVHGLVGGQKAGEFLPLPPPQNQVPVPGLMSVAATAAYDPIFWLHRCNIDRLWGRHSFVCSDRSDVILDTREFMLPNPDRTFRTFTTDALLDAAALGYSYADLTSGAHVQDQCIVCE